MKKLIFAVLVVLLAILAVTCDSAIFSGTGAGPGAVGPVEPGMVTLDINVAESRARAMDGGQASGDSDFYEVVFVSPGGKTYRQTHNKTSGVNGDGTAGPSFRISVPEGDYDNPASATAGHGTAILFAGKNNTTEKTLLGVGVMTVANGTGGNGATQIVYDTTAVTFTVNALTAAVTAAAGTSSFQTTTPVTSVSTVSINGTNYPAYAIVTSSSITATYTIASSTMAATVSNLVNISAGSFTIANNDSAATVLTVTGGSSFTTITPNNGTLTTPLTSGFTINFTSSTTDTWSKLWMQVPVTTVNNGTIGENGTTPVSAGIWYLRGGINNTTVDPTPATPATHKGGAVLLKVGNPESMIDITITVSP